MTTTTLEPLISDPITELQQTTVKNLRTALGLLKTKGVGTCDLYNEYSDRYCSLGAITAARFDVSEYGIHGHDAMSSASSDWPEVSELVQTIKTSVNPLWLEREQAAEPFVLIYRFNDANPGGVVQIFEDTIKRLS